MLNVHSIAFWRGFHELHGSFFSFGTDYADYTVFGFLGSFVLARISRIALFLFLTLNPSRPDSKGAPFGYTQKLKMLGVMI